MPRQARVRVPATTANLGPGFDVLGMALSIHDEVRIEIRDDDTPGLLVEYPDGFDLTVPRDASNYLARGAAVVFEHAGMDPASTVLTASGAVPVARGLGSSASALVAGAVAADAVAATGLDRHSILRLLVDIEGHAEQLAAALFGGFVSVTSRGGLRSDPAVVHLDVDPSLTVVLAIPTDRLDTSDARHVLPSDVPLDDAVCNVAAATALVAGLARADRSLIGIGMQDRVHQDARASLVPAAPDVMAAAREAGAAGACWSGAGPTMLAICLDGDDTDAVATSMSDAFAAHGVDCQTITCDVESNGCSVLDC